MPVIRGKKKAYPKRSRKQASRKRLRSRGAKKKRYWCQRRL